jgi:hypothetical protein
MAYRDDLPVIAKMKASTQSTLVKLLMVSLLMAGSILITACTKQSTTPTSMVNPTGQSVSAATQGSITQDSTRQPGSLGQSSTPPIFQTTTPTLTPPVTPTEACWVIITADRAVLRTGPGRNYAIAGTATKGEKYLLLGRNHVGDWLYILFGLDKNAWLPAILGKISCNLNSLPEIPGPLTPIPPQTPTATKPTQQPYGGGLLIPPDLAGAAPVPAANPVRAELSMLMLLILGGVLVVINGRIFLPKSKAILKRSSQYILQLLTSVL